MTEGYAVTPQPQVGQQGPAWRRWLDRYAQEHAATVAQLAVLTPALELENALTTLHSDAVIGAFQVGLNLAKGVFPAK